MTEVYPSDNTLLNLTSESETGVEYIETGKAPYYLEFRKLLSRLLLATKRANDLRVFDEGGSIQNRCQFSSVHSNPVMLQEEFTHFVLQRIVFIGFDVFVTPQAKINPCS